MYFHRGQGSSPQAQNLARQLGYKLHQLKNNIQGALVDRVVEDFCDISTPLKQFTEAVLAPEGVLDTVTYSHSLTPCFLRRFLS